MLISCRDDCAEATLGVSKSKYISQPTYAEAQAYYTRALTAGAFAIIHHSQTYL